MQKVYAPEICTAWLRGLAGVDALVHSVLASDEAVTRWRQQLGIAPVPAAPGSALGGADALMHILKRLDKLEEDAYHKAPITHEHEWVANGADILSGNHVYRCIHCSAQTVRFS